MQSSNQRSDHIAIWSGAIAIVSLLLVLVIPWIFGLDGQLSAVVLPLMILFIVGTIVCTVMGLVAVSQQEGIPKSNVIAIFALMALNLAALCVGIALLSGYRPPAWFDIPKMPRDNRLGAVDGRQ